MTPAPAELGGGYVFPLPSEHEYGDGFGAGRGHDGQDLFAKCGRKLVAANDGKIQRSEKDGSGYGNIVVLDLKGTGVDLLYAHMKNRVVKKGDRVNAGEKIGEVGDSGNASGLPPPLRDAHGARLLGRRARHAQGHGLPEEVGQDVVAGRSPRRAHFSCVQRGTRFRRGPPFRTRGGNPRTGACGLARREGPR